MISTLKNRGSLNLIKLITEKGRGLSNRKENIFFNPLEYSVSI